MNKKRSDTQYLFKVDLKRQESELRGVALLGHQTLAELHEAISGEFERSAHTSYSFRFGNVKLEENVRLDSLKLRIGQTLEYIVDAVGEHRDEIITVDFIDRE